MHYQYVNPNTLLLVNTEGVLKKLYTPFRAICIASSRHIPLRTWVYVDEVWSNEEDELKYLIAGQLHHYSNFDIPTFF